jgi:methylmalonyl-CoA mutase C-terminal domain/subunit
VAVPGELLSPPGGDPAAAPRVLMAKTSLDGHWRGVTIVSRALRDAGFEVILAGMVTADHIARAAADEDVDLIGLNVGGRVEVVERILDTLADAGVQTPVVAGGTIPHYALARLTARGVECFPPGSALEDIVAAARRLTAGPAGPSSGA